MSAMNQISPHRSRIPAPARPQRGLSLIELMISITLGMLVVAALLALYLNVTRTNSEMEKANRQIENGRFAIQVLESDIVHAGFWGRLGYTMPPEPAFPVPSAIPDPCVVTGWNDDYKKGLLGIPVQGYANGSTLSGCGVTGVLTSSDVLLVRHANTCTAGTAGCEGGTDTGPHIQVSGCQAGSPVPEAAYVIDTKGAATLKLRDKDCATVAPLRKVVTNLYYTATSNGQPTLMRVRLVNGVYAAPEPLIEGIEAFRVEYGIDTLGKNGLAISGTNPGDGSADEFKTSTELAGAAAGTCTTAGTACNLASNIVAVKVHVLARNLKATPGYTDTKAYYLGKTKIDAANDDFKRHVFSTTVRLVNPSGRRETP